MKNKIIILSVVIVGGALLFLTFVLPRLNYGNKIKNAAIVSTPSASPSLSPMPARTTNPTASSQPAKLATCKVEGNINFLTAAIAQNLGAKLSYTGIDSKARQITWHVSPADDLKIGPNLIVQMKVPDDTSMVTAILPASPVSKNYTLTASMTSGTMLPNGSVKIYNIACAGSINVGLDF